MTLLSENIRYLLWREHVEPANWATQVARWAGSDLSRAESLLCGGAAQPEEIKHMAAAVGLSADVLQSERLLTTQHVNVLVENLRHLVGSLDRGQKKVLAADLGVHPATLSRWCSGELHPRKAHQGTLCVYFGLPRNTDLASEPLFLNATPPVDRKAWLRERIDQIDSATLDALFPALERLLK